MVNTNSFIEGKCSISNMWHQSKQTWETSKKKDAACFHKRKRGTAGKLHKPQPNSILRRHKCFKCRQRGHVVKNCPMKTQSEGTEMFGNRSKSAQVISEGFMATKRSVSLKYPELIHFETKCMIKGTDQGHWDDIVGICPSIN
ncbi:ARID DNA-binding domain-containing protein [Tanacetum coccineum]